MAKCPVVHGVSADGADDGEPEAGERHPRRGEMRDAAGHRRQGGDDAHHRVDDRGVSGDTEIGADAASDEQVPGEAEPARDGEQVTTERACCRPGGRRRRSRACR